MIEPEEVPILLNEVRTISKFVNHLTTMSLTRAPAEQTDFVGAGFEALIEVLITKADWDKRIDINDYVPWSELDEGDDYGIDGVGISHHGQVHTVQIKLRSHHASYLTPNDDHLSNFVAKSLCMYWQQDIKMTIFTTAESVACNIIPKMYHDKVRVIGYKDLQVFIDENDAFWNLFYSELL
jgi:hypothetical protein